MATTHPPETTETAQSSKRRGRGLLALSPLDQLIVGALFLKLAVYVSEMTVVFSCGGWFDLKSCESVQTNAVFGDWIKIDPFFADMPGWYAAIMTFADFLFNPFWLLSVFMYATLRQERPWFRTATIAISSMSIIGTIVTFVAQVDHPDITVRNVVLIIIINSPWVYFPALFIWRMHRATYGFGQRSGGPTIQPTRA